MNKNFIGNNEAFLNLDSYARSQNPGPLILSGKRGLGKRQAAMDVISHFMGCSKDRLYKDPDFYMLDRQHETIKVEDVLALLEKSALAALKGKKFFLVCNAENMNVQAQNKLLKLLEDKNSTNVIIFLCNQDIDVLLETIKSRCNVITFNPLSIKEIEPYFMEKGIAKEELLFAAYLCDFCPHAIEDIAGYYPVLLETCQKLMQARKKEDFFQILHLIREKDPENFYEVHSEHYWVVLQMFYYLFEQLLIRKLNISSGENSTDFKQLEDLYSLSHVYQVCSTLTAHQKQWQDSSYSKNDFFDLIRSMVKEQPHTSAEMLK